LMEKCSEQNEHQQTSSNSSDNDSNKENHQMSTNNKTNIINFLNSEIQYSSSQYYNNSNSSSYNKNNLYNSNKQKVNNASVNDVGSSGDSGVASAIHSMSSTDSETATIDSNEEEMVMSNNVAWNGGNGGERCGADEYGDIIYKESKNVSTKN
jgi:hypothetical protein